MNISEVCATPARGLDDAELATLEAMWRVAVAAMEAAYESGLEDHALEAVARRIEDLEGRIATTPANASCDVATKLRIILKYEEAEPERRHWLPLLQSALADLERRTAP